LAAYPELSDDEWVVVVKRLTHHAAWQINRHAWRGLRLDQGGSVPGGVDPADLASEAITDVINGTRNWNQESDPDFLDYLRSVVDSKVSHLVRRRENRVSRRMAPPDDTDEPGFDAPGPDLDPLILYIEQESIEERQKFLDRRRDEIRQQIAGDKLAEGILNCLAEGYTKPADMAVLLGVEVKEINNAQKRLRRAVEAIVKNTQKR
jgi:hypothetical protein